jgi:1-deoxy-D-xylulose-5-phosphate synthase
MANSHNLLITVEENAVFGGAGSGVLEFLAQQGIVMPVLQIGLPDQFLPHAKPTEMLADCGLNAKGIEKMIADRLALLKSQTRKAQ